MIFSRPGRMKKSPSKVDVRPMMGYEGLSVPLHAKWQDKPQRCSARQAHVFWISLSQQNKHHTAYTRSQPKIHVGGYWIEGTDSKCMLKDRRRTRNSDVGKTAEHCSS